MNFGNTSDRELTTNQSTGTSKVQLGEPMNFIGFTYRNVGLGLLTGIETSQRQL